MPQETSENLQNIKVTLESYETHENLGFPLRIIKSKKKIFERKTKIIEIFEVHVRSAKIKYKKTNSMREEQKS